VTATPALVEVLEERDVNEKVAQVALRRTENNLDDAYVLSTIFRLDDDDLDASGVGRSTKVSSSSVLLSSLELRDTKVYEPYIRARLGTAAHLCELVVLKLNSTPQARDAKLAQYRNSLLGGKGVQPAEKDDLGHPVFDLPSNAVRFARSANPDVLFLLLH